MTCDSEQYFALQKLGLLILLLVAFVSGCKESSSLNGDNRVEVRRGIGKYNFHINGNQFKVKGAVLNNACSDSFKKLYEAGANAVKTSKISDIQMALDSANKYGFMVAIGLDIGRNQYGFDYTNRQLVDKQFQRVQAAILKYKNHPNLLCWIVGEKMNEAYNKDGELLDIDQNTYKAISDIIGFIHEKDPNHPASTSFMGIDKNQIEKALSYCPNLDFLSYQVYGEFKDTEELAKSVDSDLPYLISEFGSIGHWEAPKTSWDREIEDLSHIKATKLKESINDALVSDESGYNLGSFSYLWGQKQERTPTWFGAFLETCESTEIVDELTAYWKGEYPANRSPQLNRLTIDGERAKDNVRLNIGQEYVAEAFVIDPEKDKLTYKWHILAEADKAGLVGEFEENPGSMRFRIFDTSRNFMKFKPPPEEGEYRLYVFVYDKQGNAAYGNIPIKVE